MYQPSVVQLSKLPVDPQGGVDVDIPINTPAPSGAAFPELYAEAESGVFPLQVGLYTTAGKPLGKPVSTFLVFAQGPPSKTGYAQLSVAVVLPFHAAPNVDPKGQVQPATATQSRQLASLVEALASHPDVAVTLGVTPQTLDALAAGDAAARSTLSGLQQVVRSGTDQILPSTYAAVSTKDMLSTGLAGDVTKQLQMGSTVLTERLGKTPASTGWVVNGPLDPDVLGDLVGRGATQLIVPDADLSPFPPAAQLYTFAYPTQLVGPGVPPNAKVTTFAADAGLTSDFNNPGGAVLAASQLLAEMAMIQVETPSYTRGVAVVPPAGWAANPVFIDTLLAGLEDHPLLQAVTTSGLFSKVSAPATGPVERSLAGAAAQAGVAPRSGSAATSSGAPRAGAGGSGGGSSLGAGDATAIQAARAQLQALALFAPTEQQTAKSLQVQLLVSESQDLTESQRQALLNAVTGTASKLLGGVSLPHSSSITLTSTRGEIPLTILSSNPLHVHVRLQLSSERLFFHAFNPPSGHCVVSTSSTEVCDLTLTTHNTTLKVPVETRSSGVFPLNVSLLTPDGSQQLGLDSDTVRSTAVSNVGIILIVLAVVSLAIWWVRDLRHGRRARQLVPSPSEDDDAADDESVVVDLDDPVVTGFFATAPPEYEEPESLQRRP